MKKKKSEVVLNESEIIEEKPLIAFKAYIRVVKSLNENNRSGMFDSVTVLVEKLIYAKDKAHVKKILLEKYPQFFPTEKINEKETKDQD